MRTKSRYTYDGNAAGNYYVFRPDGAVFLEVHGSEDDATWITHLLNKAEDKDDD